MNKFTFALFCAPISAGNVLLAMTFSITRSLRITCQHSVVRRGVEREVTYFTAPTSACCWLIFAPTAMLARNCHT